MIRMSLLAFLSACTLQPGEAIVIGEGVDDPDDSSADCADAEMTLWHADADGDGFGDPEGESSCEPLAGMIADGSDCDDSDAAVNPDAAEACGNAVDENCDGLESTCGWTGETSLAEAAVRVEGESANGAMGDAVVSLGDVDGDGLDEIAVSSYQASLSAGRAWIVPGAALVDGAKITELASATMTGQSEYTDAARVMAAVGDVSGDAVPDLLLGTDRAGLAWVVSGDATGAFSLDEADSRIEGSVSGMFGTAVASAGDVNGDGQPDFLVGEPASDRAAGAAYLFLGPIAGGDSSTEHAAAAFTGAGSDYAGYSVTGGHDIDGDGFDDPVVATLYGPGSHGAVWVIGDAADPRSALADATAVLVGDTYTDSMAGSVASVGDSDGDGYGDLLIGAYRDGDGGVSAGAVYLMRGPLQSGDIGTMAASKLVGRPGDYLGLHVADLGDLNADGYADLGFPTPYADSYQGAAYVAYGPVAAGTADISGVGAAFSGEARANYAGAAMASGDVTGDGVLDLLVTATYWTGGELMYSGALYAVAAD